eukprot:COSAG06_NODE_251_length_19092_cov_52.770126_18_plen_235_part_00
MCRLHIVVLTVAWLALARQAAAGVAVMHQVAQQPPDVSAAAAAGVSASGRGVGDGKSQLAEDMRLLGGLSWWYDWGLVPSAGTTAPDQEFVAMAWGAGHKGQPLQEYLGNWTPHPTTKHLLGFNEPNLRHQSNLNASAACALWPLVTGAAKQHGMRVGSPAANHCTPHGNGSQDSNCFQEPMDWFDDFFATPGCGLETVDFITTHKYGCNVSARIFLPAIASKSEISKRAHGST